MVDCQGRDTTLASVATGPQYIYLGRYMKADEARLLTKYTINDISSLLHDIKEACNKGEYSIRVTQYYTTENQIQQLEGLGYSISRTTKNMTINEFDNYVTYYNISWEK